MERTDFGLRGIGWVKKAVLVQKLDFDKFYAGYCAVIYFNESIC